jgi:hypothetical protein
MAGSLPHLREPAEVGMPRRGVRQSSQRDDPTVDSTIWIEEQARRLRYLITKAV